MAAQLHFGAGDSVTLGPTGSAGVGSSLSFLKSSIPNLTAGDVIIAWFGGQSSGAGDVPSAPSGWVHCGSNPGAPDWGVSRNSSMWYYAIPNQAALDALPEKNTWTFPTASAANGRGGFVIARATGLDTANPVDSQTTTFSAVGSETSTYGISSITTTSADALLVGGVYRHNAASTSSPSTSSFMTAFSEYKSVPEEATTLANTAAVLGYKNLSSAGNTGPQTITFSGAGTRVGGELVAFRAIEQTPPSVPRPTVVASSQTSTTSGLNSATSFTIKKPAGVIDGDLMIVAVSAQTATSTGDFSSAGWKRISASYVPLSTGYRITAFYAKPVKSVSSEAAASYTFASTDPTGGRIAATAFAVRGADLTSITAGAPDMASNAGSSIITPLGTPTANRSLLLMTYNAQFTSGNNPAVATAPADMALVSSALTTSTNGSVTANYVYSQNVEAVDQGLRTLAWSSTPAQSSSASVYVRASGEPDQASALRSIYYTSSTGAAKKAAGVYYTSKAKTLTPALEMRPFPEGYRSVETMLAAKPFYVAHRGGSKNWPEMSLFAYTQSGYWGAGALEISLARTSDGVWFGLHDQSLDRTSLGKDGATLIASSLTWSQVQSYEILGSVASSDPTQPNRPYMRLEDILKAYYPSHVLFLDIKYAMAYVDEFIAKLATLSGKPRDHIVGKAFGVGGDFPNKMRAAGYKTWGYFYQTNVENGDLAKNVSYWDILGMDYNADQASWTAIRSYGKPVMAHILPSVSALAAAQAYGADGYMVSGVKAVVPRRV